MFFNQLMKCKSKSITVNHNSFCAFISLGLQIKPQVDTVFNLTWMNTWYLQSVQWAVLLSWCQSWSWSIIRYVFITNFHQSEWIQSDFRPARIMWEVNEYIRMFIRCKIHLNIRITVHVCAVYLNLTEKNSHIQAFTCLLFSYWLDYIRSTLPFSIGLKFNSDRAQLDRFLIKWLLFKSNRVINMITN